MTLSRLSATPAADQYFRLFSRKTAELHLLPRQGPGSELCTYTRRPSPAPRTRGSPAGATSSISQRHKGHLAVSLKTLQAQELQKCVCGRRGRGRCWQPGGSRWHTLLLRLGKATTQVSGAWGHERAAHSYHHRTQTHVVGV